MTRPYWSGQFQLSLVAFGIQLFPATEAKSEIHFHQLNRRTGERVKYRKTSGEDGPPVSNDEIVKGYEYTKGEYVMIEPGDIENLRIPSKQTLEVTQFVDPEEIDPAFFEKPYFVTPQNPSQAEAFAVVRKAMQATKKIALGKIAFGGREHLIAISAPESDEHLGMMAYTMRYAEELRRPAQYFADIKKFAIDEDQLQLAKELIKRKASKFDADKFKDQYENALRAMVEAKVKNAPLPKEQSSPQSTKVINLMDALRKSVMGNSDESDKPSPKKAPARVTDKSEQIANEKKIALVKSPAKSPRSSAKRKSA